MNSTSIKIKKFLSNRNTVTIICAVLGIIVLYVGYTMRVQSAVEPVSIPYAKVTIQPRTQITEEMIGYMEIASAALEKMGNNVITNKSDLVDYYTNINTMIPKGSFFYQKAVVKKEDLPDSAVYDVKEGEVLHYFTVNMSTSYVNAIVPNGYIDLYVSDKDDYGKVRVGKFIKNIKVLSVKDSNGLNVFENSDELRTPSYIIIAVTAEQHNYLVTAAELGIRVFPVPTSISEKEVAATEADKIVTSEEIMDYIDKKSERFEQIVESNDNNQEQEDSNNDTENQTSGE